MLPERAIPEVSAVVPASLEDMASSSSSRPILRGTRRAPNDFFIVELCEQRERDAEKISKCWRPYALFDLSEQVGNE